MKRNEREKPTTAQLDYARVLIDTLQFDPEWYDLEAMSRGQLARLIEKLEDDVEKHNIVKQQIYEVFDAIEAQDRKGK